MENHVYPFLGRTYALSGACCLKIGARVIIAHRRAAVKRFEGENKKVFAGLFQKAAQVEGRAAPRRAPQSAKSLCFARSARGELQKQSGGLFLQEVDALQEGVPFVRRGGLTDASQPGKGRGENPVIDISFCLAEPNGFGSSCA